MAAVYVSYKSDDEQFVHEVVNHLLPKHNIFIDYMMPVGVDWRNHMIDKLKDCEVFLVFASSLTSASDYQNAEIGAARFCSNFVDQKLIIPVLIDQGPLPRTLQDLDAILEMDRNPVKTAEAILEAIERRTPRIRLFISHSHKDEDLASRLVDVIVSGLTIPQGAMRCTSVPGFQLDIGTMAPEALRRELGSSACVVAILTPNSVASDWVLFELGAAWANAKVAIPLFAGGISDKDIPGPFRGAAGGELKDPVTLDALVNQLERNLGWRQNHELPTRKKRFDLAEYAKQKSFPRDPMEEEARLTFAAKLARIGTNQAAIINYISQKRMNRPFTPQRELEEKFSKVQTNIYYRLEQLRLLGFLQRVQIGEINGEPTYGWDISAKYKQEIGL